MNAEVYAEWCRRRGCGVVHSPSSYWYSEGLGVYEAFPFHWLIHPDEAELKDLFSNQRILALRYSAPPDHCNGHLGYHAVYEGNRYELEDLGGWARKNVRRGLKSCAIERIPFERFLEEGWDLRADTLDRQRRRGESSREAWRRKYALAADLPGFEIWGALVHGELAAFLLTFRMADCLNMLHQQCRREYLREHVNNALAFVVTKTAVADPSVRCVYYGGKSADAPPSVDEFKFRMGYHAKPVRQCVLFHPWASPFVNRFTHGTLQGMRKLVPGSRILAKAEGMVRCQRSGRAQTAHS